ncbi:MAG: hypothetical protein AAGK37_04315 [Pseudomonadota bacterium]
MEPNFQYSYVDIVEAEARARKLRAEAMRDGMRSLGRWVKGPFRRNETVRL